MPLGKKAFYRGDLSTGRVEPSVNPSDWKALEKKYGEDGAEDFVEARSEAAQPEFNRLVVAAIGERPESEGDYDKNPATRVYFNVIAKVEQAIKGMAHNERSIKLDYRNTEDYRLTRYKNKYASGPDCALYGEERLQCDDERFY